MRLSKQLFCDLSISLRMTTNGMVAHFTGCRQLIYLDLSAIKAAAEHSRLPQLIPIPIFHMINCRTNE